MAKASVSAELLKKKISKEEKQARIESEKKLKGNNDKLEPSDNLTEGAKIIYKVITTELKESGVLGNIDTYIIETTATALDRINRLNLTIETETDMDNYGKLIRTQDVIMKQFYKGCQELCLSPSSRAKISSINTQKQEEKQDPLLKLLAQRNT